jgi:hypothetical protein
MSYDLFFLKPREQAGPTPAELKAWFEGRPHYELDHGEALYSNEDTGVDFSFGLESDDDEEQAADDGLAPAGLSFNVNYCRPHVFGLEAEGELSALAKRFGLFVDDPQADGMGRGRYTPAGFLRGWNAGNLAAHSLLFARGGPEDEEPDELDTLPAAALEAAWRFNYRRPALQERVGPDVHVSPVRLVRHGDAVRTLAIWGDAIPQALPEVDLLLLVRDALRPRGQREEDTCLARFAELRPLLRLARRLEHDGLVVHVFEQDPPPAELVAYFRAQVPFDDELEALALEDVLTQELVAQSARAGGSREGEQD